MAVVIGKDANNDPNRDEDESYGIFLFLWTDEDNNQRIISSYRLTRENFKTVTVDEIFPVNSCWNDRELLYNTIKTYATLTGWKPILTHKIYIRWSCFQRHISRIKETKNTSKASINKECQWEVRIKSTKNRNQEIKAGPNKGTQKTIPVFWKDVPVMITRASLGHTGTCEPCSQQQMIVRQRSGQYVAKLSIDTIYTLCSMYTQFGSICFLFSKYTYCWNLQYNCLVCSRTIW